MYEKGIHYICDITKLNKEFLTFDELQAKYNLKLNFLTYQGLISSIKSYMKTYKSYRNESYLPCIQPHVDIILKNKSGAKDMYLVLCAKVKDKPSCIDRWKDKVNIIEKDWKQIT